MALSPSTLRQFRSILTDLAALLRPAHGSPARGAGLAIAQAPPVAAPAQAPARPAGVRALAADQRQAPASSGVPSSLSLPSSSWPQSGSSDPSVPASPGEQVLLVGNKRRARTLRSYFEVMQKRGFALPFDPARLDPKLLDTVVPKGQTAALSPDGRLLGMTTTAAVMADDNLGLQNHMAPGRGVETHTQGGDVVIDGVRHDVAQSFLKSPIMLDLNGDGALGTTGVSTAKQRIDGQIGHTVSFDIDGDGQDDQIEWMDGQGDGMLVDDRDGGATAAMRGDGKIDGTRLFGDQGGKYANGYDKLAERDFDHDGQLTGAELAGLKTWVDDGDAKVEEGELKTLAELGISQLGAGMTLEQNARGEQLMRSTFVRNGRTGVTEDVWFRAATAARPSP